MFKHSLNAALAPCIYAHTSLSHIVHARILEAFHYSFSLFSSPSQSAITAQNNTTTSRTGPENSSVITECSGVSKIFLRAAISNFCHEKQFSGPEFHGDRMGSKLQFKTTVLKTSKQCKTSAANRILISHPTQVLWGFENGKNILPNLVESADSHA